VSLASHRRPESGSAVTKAGKPDGSTRVDRMIDRRQIVLSLKFDR
jgi:hypothetical protein